MQAMVEPSMIINSNECLPARPLDCGTHCVPNPPYIDQVFDHVNAHFSELYPVDERLAYGLCGTL